MDIRHALAAFAFVLALTAPAGAVTKTVPPVAADFIAAGGGPGSFSTIRAFTKIVGDNAFQSALLQQRNRFGADDTNRFVEVFDYAISDGWKRAGQSDVSIHSDSSLQGQQLIDALIQLGTDSGKFNSGTLFNNMFTPKVSIEIAGDIAKKYGNDAMISFYRIADGFFNSLKDTSSSG